MLHRIQGRHDDFAASATLSSVCGPDPQAGAPSWQEPEIGEDFARKSRCGIISASARRSGRLGLVRLFLEARDRWTPGPSLRRGKDCSEIQQKELP